MGQPAATQTTQVIGTDIHMVLVPTPGGPVPVPLPHVFSGTLQSGTVPTVTVAGQPLAVQDSVAVNSPAHVPTPPGASFQSPPSNQGRVLLGSATVTAGGKGVARVGDQVSTCNFPTDAPVSVIVGGGTVMIG